MVGEPIADAGPDQSLSRCGVGDNQFGLVMKVVRVRRIGNIGAARGDRVGGLGEENGRIGFGVPAHLSHMRRVVFSHAEDAPDGKTHARALYRDGRNIGGLKDEISHWPRTPDQRLTMSASISNRSRTRPTVWSTIVSMLSGLA